MDEDQPARLDRRTVDGLVQLARDLNATDDLPTMLSVFARALRDVAEFACAAISLVNDAGDLQVVAVSGPPDVEEALLGTIGTREHWDQEFARAEVRGGVHLYFGGADDRDFPVWISDDEAYFSRTADDPRAWRPDYSAYVPIHEADGSLLGVVSVDLPHSGLIPDAHQLATLEILARQAESSIVTARSAARNAVDEHIFGSVFEITGAPMCVSDETGRITQANRAFRESIGDVGRVEDLAALTTVVEDAEDLVDEFARIIDGRHGASTFVIGRGLPDRLRWFHVALRGAAYVGSTPQRVVCTMTDITAERQTRQRFQHDAEHDQLTGLLNRRGIRGAIDRLVARRAAGDQLVSIYLDLDGFKTANDLHGHVFGDQVLVDIAASLREAAPDPAVLGRVGGDEFVVLATVGSRPEAEKLADAVVAAVDVRLPDSTDRVTTSAGMAVADCTPTCDVGALMQAADEALYRAKVDGGHGWVAAPD